MRILGIDPGTLVVGYGCLAVSTAGATAKARARQASASAAVPLAHRVGNVVQAARQSSKVELLEVGVLRLGASKDPIEKRLHCLAQSMNELLQRLQPDELALEEAFFGKSVQSALRIGEARGVILAQAAAHGLVCSQFAPATVKKTVTGRGAASKDQVARMVASQLQMSTLPEPQDVTDALAVALCSMEQRRSFRA